MSDLDWSTGQPFFPGKPVQILPLTWGAGAGATTPTTRVYNSNLTLTLWDEI